MNYATLIVNNERFFTSFSVSRRQVAQAPVVQLRAVSPFTATGGEVERLHVTRKGALIMRPYPCALSLYPMPEIQETQGRVDRLLALVQEVMAFYSRSSKRVYQTKEASSARKEALEMVSRLSRLSA